VESIDFEHQEVAGPKGERDTPRLPELANDELTPFPSTAGLPCGAELSDHPTAALRKNSSTPIISTKK
jgi:hypothetical protein